MEQFLIAMKYKLYVHSNKGSFDWKTSHQLISQLKAEVAELEEALATGDKERIISEAADVANYAFFIADKAVRGLKDDFGLECRKD